jgi:hypothetical protein
MTNENTIQVLEQYGDRIREQAVENLMNNKSFITGDLARSITNEVFENEMKAVISVNEWYGIVVEEGIGRKAGEIPPIAPIKNWIKRRNLRPKPGVSLDSFAWAIATNIGKKGTNPKARPFLAPAVKLVKEQYGDEALLEATGLDINESIITAYKQ